MDQTLTDESTPTSPPVPSQTVTYSEVTVSLLCAQSNKMRSLFFFVYSDSEFDFYIRIVCSHLVSGPRIQWSQSQRASMPAVGNEWPLSPAGMIRETASHMY